MPTVDDKVVSMSFESAKFEEGVSRAIDALKKLEMEIRHIDTGKGMATLATSAQQIDLGHIHNGISEISSRLGALRLTAIAVFADIAKKAVSMGTQLLKSVTLNPLKTGLAEYETQINAVQTIMANTSAAGTKLKDVNAALNELNTYADKTIYNFGEMTRNIGLFTAAGVDLKTSVASIKGIANLAAVSGSNAEMASRAMYQLSQAISSGTVKLMDWKSVVNAGMGGTVFQRALANTAVNMGTLDKKAVSVSGAMKNIKINGEKFSASLASAGPGKESWLTGKVLTNTLKQLSGDMTNAQLKAEGYTDAQVKAIQTQAKLAVDAATKVKTLTQLLSTTKEQLGTGWARTWMLVFGDFGEAKVLFTGLSNAIGGFISANAKARNKVIGDWKALGGRAKLLSALKIAFHDLTAVLKPIKQAFRDIFPAVTGKQLFDLTVRFKHFMQELKPSPETIDLLRRTFRGLFAILDIGKQLLFGVLGIFGKVFGSIAGGTGGFLKITASVGDWLVKVDEALKKGGRLNKFFEGLGKVLAAPIKAIVFLRDLLVSAFGGGASKGVDGITKTVGPLTAAFHALAEILSSVFGQISKLAGIFEPILQSWVDLMSQLPSLLGQALSAMSWEPILAVIRTGLLFGMYKMFKGFFGKGAGIDQLMRGFSGIGGGLIGNINKSLGALTGQMQAMQQSLKAKTLKDIAIAVALLAVSMVALSFVDPKKLNSALGAITIAFAQLLGAMAILGNVSKSMGFVKMPVIAATLIILAGAIFVLSASVIALSLLSWEQLTKGLIGVGVLLGALVLAVGPLSAASFGMTKAGIGLIAIGVGLNILALAVRQFGSMDLMTLGKGMASIGVGLFIIATYIKMFPKGPSMVLQGAGLIAIAVALNILAVAILALGSMKLETLGKGMGAIGISLAIIAGAMRIMPKSMILQAAGLMLVAAALNGIAVAVRIMGGQSLTSLAKGLGGLAYSLGLLAGMLNLMTGTISGAIALGIAAASIAVLVPALILLGKQDIKVIAVGLIALAAAFGVIAAAGILLDAAAPGLLAFGITIALIGAGLALAGAGIMLAALGISALVAAIVVAAGVIPKAFVDLQKSLVENAKLLVLGVLEIVQAFADTAPQFVDALVEILKSVIVAVTELVPMIEKLATVLLEALIRVLDQQQGPIVEAIIGLVMAILTGIRNHIGEVVTTVLIIIQNLLLAIARNIGKIAKAGADIVIALVKGIAGNYARIVGAVLGIIAKFLNTIANNIGKIVTAGGNIVVKFLNGIARNITRVTAAATNVIVAFINGIGNAGPRIIAAAVNTMIKFMNALAKNAPKLANAGFKAIIAFLNGIADAIDQNSEAMGHAGARIGIAIVAGLATAIRAGVGDIKDALLSLLPGPLKKFAGKLGLSSPSKVFYKFGEQIIQGLANGMTENGKDVEKASIDTANSVITMFEDVLEITSPSKRMKRIGNAVTAGFAAGIKSGAEEDIRTAFAELKRRMNEQEADIRKQIKRRDVLLSKKKPTKEETAELKTLIDAVGKHQKALQGATRAQDYLNKGIDANKKKLFEQVKAYSDVLKKIDDVNSLIEELKTKYSELPDIVREATDEAGDTKKLTGAEQLAQYTKDLTAQVAAVKRYNEILQALRAAGLDDTTYRMLLEEGTTGLEFAQGLLDAGAPAINQLKTLDTDLGSISDTLGKNAASNLYTAGKYAAQGLLDGLLAEKGAIEAEMERLGGVMVRAIKNKLKIKSPSEVFAEIGKQSMEGMAQGLADSTGLMTDAADEAAKEAMVAMERSMRDISDVVAEGLDSNPVITPILDLTQVKSKAAELAALKDRFAMDSAYAQASAISATKTKTEAEQVAAVGGTNFKFEQNNYSPESLSDIQIYRQTKNQLSQIKAALALT